MGFRALAIAATVFSALAWAGNATALSFRTFNFTGVVTSAQTPTLDGSITVGTPFSGSYTFNPDALDTLPASPDRSSFQSPASDGYGLAIDIGNYHSKTSGLGILDISVRLGFGGTDFYTFSSFVSGPGGSHLLGTVTGQLAGPSPIFTSDALPLAPPPLTSFTSRGFGIFLPIIDVGEVAIRVGGELTSLTPTPEPTTLLLWGTTVAGVGFVARWRQRRRGKQQPKTEQG